MLQVPESKNADRRFRWSASCQPGEGLVGRGGVEPPTFAFQVWTRRFEGLSTWPKRSHSVAHSRRCAGPLLHALLHRSGGLGPDRPYGTSNRRVSSWNGKGWEAFRLSPVLATESST